VASCNLKIDFQPTGAAKMMMPRLAALMGAAALVAAGWCHAAAVPLKALPPASAPVAFAAAAHEATEPGRELPVGLAIAAAPAPLPAPARDDPFYTSLLEAGRFVLDVGSFSQQRAPARTLSAAPLPGALWLFGSALLAFLAIAGRRKF
jgi:hypothetical protein